MTSVRAFLLFLTTQRHLACVSMCERKDKRRWCRPESRPTTTANNPILNDGWRSEKSKEKLLCFRNVADGNKMLHKYYTSPSLFLLLLHLTHSLLLDVSKFGNRFRCLNSAHSEDTNTRGASCERLTWRLGMNLRVFNYRLGVSAQTKLHHHKNRTSRKLRGTHFRTSSLDVYWGLWPSLVMGNY